MRSLSCPVFPCLAVLGHPFARGDVAKKNMTRPVNHPFCYGADCRTPFCAIASTKLSTAISLMADALWRGDGGVNRWRNGVLNDCTLGPPRCIGPICVCETKDSRDFAFVSADQFCSQLKVNCSIPGCSWAHLPINIHLLAPWPRTSRILPFLDSSHLR